MAFDCKPNCKSELKLPSDLVPVITQKPSETPLTVKGILAAPGAEIEELIPGI